MVVKSATKKKLMDLGCPEYMAHRWADDRRWYEEIVPMNFDDIIDNLPHNMTVVNVQNKREHSEYIYDIVKTIRDNELDRMMVISRIDPLRVVVGSAVPGGQKRVAEYIKMIENFGRIPAGSPYYYLIEDSPNFINWSNENPLEGK